MHLRRADVVLQLDKVRNDEIGRGLKQEAVKEIARKQQRAWKVKIHRQHGQRTISECPGGYLKTFQKRSSKYQIHHFNQ